jgi:hypothetical protein
VSNALALAGVTAVLKDLLNDGVVNADLNALGNVSVTSVPPDRLIAPDGSELNRLNIFLWNVAPNAAYTNTRLPSRSRDGSRVTNPFLALDLHFILTATGAAELNAEILLGFGMQILHETPVLTRATIRQSLSAGLVDGTLLPEAYRQLAAADLADQFEGIRITSVPDSDDMFTKLWPAFNTALRTSALYHVSVVLIESRQTERAAPPVLTVGDRVEQMRRPRIDRVRLQPAADVLPLPHGILVPGSRIAIDGSGLVAPLMRVDIGDRQLMPEAGGSPERVAVALPADMTAGLKQLRIIHLYEGLNAADLRPLETSNVSAIVISPLIAETGSNRPDVTVVGTVAGGLFSGTVSVGMHHPVGSDQVAEILFMSLPTAPEPFSRAYEADRRTTEVSRLGFVINGIAAGDYLMRIRIDAAETEMTMGAGGFDGPLITLAAGP